MEATLQEISPLRAAPRTVDIRGRNILPRFLLVGKIDCNGCWGNFFVSIQTFKLDVSNMGYSTKKLVDDDDAKYQMKSTIIAACCTCDITR